MRIWCVRGRILDRRRRRSCRGGGRSLRGGGERVSKEGEAGEVGLGGGCVSGRIFFLVEQRGGMYFV